MLLSQELGELPIATHGLLRQAWARPLHQHKIVLVDRSRWHLRRERLAGTGLLVYQGQLIWGCHHSCPLLYISCVGFPLSSHCQTHHSVFWAPKPVCAALYMCRP